MFVCLFVCVCVNACECVCAYTPVLRAYSRLILRLFVILLPIFLFCLICSHSTHSLKILFIICFYFMFNSFQAANCARRTEGFLLGLSTRRFKVCICILHVVYICIYIYIYIYIYTHIFIYIYIYIYILYIYMYVYIYVCVNLYM